jgi:hypothetical protein
MIRTDDRRVAGSAEKIKFMLLPQSHMPGEAARITRPAELGAGWKARFAPPPTLLRRRKQLFFNENDDGRQARPKTDPPRAHRFQKVNSTS